MAKKQVTGEDGKVYTVKEKKPFYKRVWFWIVAIIALFIIGGALGGGDDDKNGGTKVEATEDSKTEDTSTEDKDEEKEEPEKDGAYKVGDSVKVGDVTYTLKNVSLTDERNEFADTEPANVIKIEYTVQNDSDDDIPIGADVEVYDASGKKMDSYPNDNTMNSVAPGKSIDAVAHFGLDQTGDIEILFAPLISLEKAATFKVNIQ